MKDILMSIRPQHVANILNGDKKVEIRKSFPKDFQGWVYIYCTKDRNRGLFWAKKYVCVKQKGGLQSFRNGKVIARFYVTKIDQYINGCRWIEEGLYGRIGEYDDYIKDKVCEKACISENDLWAYSPDLAFSVIHITKLEVFESPLPLNAFVYLNKDNKYYSLRRPPQSWLYIHGQVMGKNDGKN